MRRRWAWALLAAALAVLLAGCWDYRDVDERALMLMLGIDRGETQKYRVSVQIPVPQGPGKEPTSGGRFRVMVEEGDSIESALERVRASLYRALDLGQLKVLIIGQEVARDGLLPLDWLWHTRRLPGVAFMAVARETAAAVVAAETPPLAIPALFVYHQFKSTHNTDDSIVPVYRWRAFGRLHSLLEDIYLPGMTTRRYGLNVAGLAVFRQARLVGWLDPQGASAFNRLRFGRFDGEETVTDPAARDVALRLVGGTSRFGVRLDQRGQPVLWAQLHAEGELRKRGGWPEPEVEARVAARLAAEVRQMITELQALESDPAGFGERLRRLAPGHPAVASPEAWRRAFARARVEVRASARVRTAGYQK